MSASRRGAQDGGLDSSLSQTRRRLVLDGGGGGVDGLPAALFDVVLPFLMIGVLYINLPPSLLPGEHDVRHRGLGCDK